jgi:hypothetical protein
VRGTRGKRDFYIISVLNSVTCKDDFNSVWSCMRITQKQQRKPRTRELPHGRRLLASSPGDKSI